jgi:hypothetical protein
MIWNSYFIFFTFIFLISPNLAKYTCGRLPPEHKIEKKNTGTWNQQVGLWFDQIKEPAVIKIEKPPEHSNSKIINN